MYAYLFNDFHICIQGMNYTTCSLYAAGWHSILNDCFEASSMRNGIESPPENWTARTKTAMMISKFGIIYLEVKIDGTDAKR